MNDDPDQAPSVAAVMPVRRSGGRPTRRAAAERDARLLAVATRMFETRGFDATTMDAVAEAAGVGKPTIYAQFRDKAELFKAIYRIRVASFLTPLADDVQAVIEAETGSGLSPVGADLDSVLGKIGLTLLSRFLAPEAIGINRIIVAEALRFPELARLGQREGWQATVSILAALLEAYAAKGRITLADPNEAADLFLSLLVGRLQRAAVLGLGELDDAAVQRRARMAVTVFLHGIAW